jgi:hypothetical protein
LIGAFVSPAIAVQVRNLLHFGDRGWSVQTRPSQRIQVEDADIGFLRGPMPAAKNAYPLTNRVVPDPRIIRYVRGGEGSGVELRVGIRVRAKIASGIRSERQERRDDSGDAFGLSTPAER